MRLTGDKQRKEVRLKDLGEEIKRGVHLNGGRTRTEEKTKKLG